MKHSEPDAGFGLYVHWPFCQSKCPYCDFNSHLRTDSDNPRWERAYLAELDRAEAETGDMILQSVFFGGGTPSLMAPETVEAILTRIRKNWRLSNDVEITLEANPTSVEAARFAAFREAGVNRVSIGVQALNDDALRKLGRMHDVAEALKALEIAGNTFDRFNFDLIYARQGQDMDLWRQELQTALSIGSRHMSLYQLTIEEGTVFHERNRRGQLQGLPDEDLAADLYLLTQEMTAKVGLPAYEVSNHAESGEESRHNLTYWRGGDYIGIGPGAHGRLSLNGQRIATEGLRLPSAWLTAVETRGSGEVPRTTLTAEDHLSEFTMMGLRLRDGISRAAYAALAGRAPDVAKIAALVEDGLLADDPLRLRATPEGMLVLNALLRELLVA